MPSFPIVDTHLHLWDTSKLRYPWLDGIPLRNRPYGLAEFDKARGAVAVEAMVFLQCEAEFSQFLDEAAWVAGQAESEPRLKGMVAWAALEKGAAVKADLERLSQHKILRGVRRIIQFEPDLDFCLNPAFIEGVNCLPEFDLSFDICIDHRHFANVIAFAKRCPDVAMVLDHIGKPDIRGGGIEPWRSQIRELAQLPNVICKLSGVATEADHKSWTREQLKPFILAAVDVFGFDRLVFGGDWPVASQAIAYPAWVETLDWALAGASGRTQEGLPRQRGRLLPAVNRTLMLSLSKHEAPGISRPHPSMGSG
jgi:L-fuconolactonase